MNFFENIRSAILSLPAVTAIVGEKTKARIWNSWQRTYATPCVIIEIDTEEEQNYLDTGKGDGIIAAVTLTCRADTHDVSDALQTALRHGMAGYHGYFDLVINSTAHSEAEPGDGSTSHWYDHVLDCTAIWSEAA